MVLYKPLSSVIDNDIITIKAETGHIIKFKIVPKVYIDIDNKKEPFYFVSFDNVYEGVEIPKNSMSLKTINKNYKNKNILTDLEYDHIQVGFIYSETDSNNHRWMLNFMDINNKHLFNYIADNINLNCPFTTMSWEDGNWHGRFTIQKKDVISLLEPVQGKFILNGKGDIGDHKVLPLVKGVDTVSLKYNIYTNMWTCDMMKKGKKVGEVPCKNIICDVPFEGNIDFSSSKPKVTAEIKAKDIKGINMALNAVIIKRK